MKVNKPVIILLVFIFFLSVSSAAGNKNSNVQVINREFYRSILQEPVVGRDDFLNKKINLLLQGRGTIKSVSSLKRYRKTIKIELYDKEAEKYGLKIHYFLFTSNEGWFKDAIVGELFEFKGQCMIITPLNTQRNAYIFDVVLADGAILVQ